MNVCVSSSLAAGMWPVKKKVWFSFQVTSLCNSEAAVISQWVRENNKYITFLEISGNLLYQHWEGKGVIHWLPSLCLHYISINPLLMQNVFNMSMFNFLFSILCLHRKIKFEEKKLSMKSTSKHDHYC